MPSFGRNCVDCPERLQHVVGRACMRFEIEQHYLLSHARECDFVLDILDSIERQGHPPARKS
jgi:hypothetical protein